MCFPLWEQRKLLLVLRESLEALEFGLNEKAARRRLGRGERGQGCPLGVAGGS